MGDDTKHSAVDPEGVLKRTALRQATHEHELDHEIKPAIMRLEGNVAELRASNTRMETKLDLALRPRPVHPFVQGTVAIAAVFWTIFLGSIAYALVRTTPARASVAPTTETARR